MQLDPNQPPPAADARDGDLNLTAREWQSDTKARVRLAIAPQFAAQLAVEMPGQK
jgi:hypothetical protein